MPYSKFTFDGCPLIFCLLENVISFHRKVLFLIHITYYKQLENWLKTFHLSLILFYYGSSPNNKEWINLLPFRQNVKYSVPISNFSESGTCRYSYNPFLHINRIGLPKFFVFSFCILVKSHGLTRCRNEKFVTFFNEVKFPSLIVFDVGTNLVLKYAKNVSIH